MMTYSRYVDYLEAIDSWVPVTRLAQELGVDYRSARKQISRLVASGRVEVRETDRGLQAMSTRSQVNV